MEFDDWRLLADRGPELVLCLDFPGGRATAGFAELAAAAPVDACFLHIGHVGRAVADEQPDAPGLLAAHARQWVRQVLATGRPVRAVLGYCAGTTMATCVADLITEAGSPPPTVLLFDSVAVTGESLCEEFTAAVESSAEHLTEAELDGARTWQAELLDTGPDDLPRIAAGLAGRYDELMGAVAGRLSLADVFRQQLTAGFTAYLAYLLLAGQGRLDMRTGTPVFLSSRDHDLPVDATRHLSVDVDHVDLLRDAEVSKLLAELLRGEHQW